MTSRFSSILPVEEALSDYLQIILAVLILLLLGLCGIPQHQKGETGRDGGGTFRGKPAGIHKREPGSRLQDIGYNEKSETRLLIEKFVEEKPEAAASLLRNWLNEEWE